jgi:D-3-phosphoglycerate dehydrogenase
MIGAREIEQMKDNAILINASRGTVVDIDALAAALESGKLAGAAIDVFPVEPKSNSEEFVSPLRKFDNVFLTPHIGGSTMEAQENIGMEVADKMAKYSDTGMTNTSVNFPEVSLPAHAGCHRLLHIHKNIPGIMAAINRVFSDNNVNISAQYLQTNDKVGYVVLDVDADTSDVALKALKSIDGTLRCRVLF